MGERDEGKQISNKQKTHRVNEGRQVTHTHRHT